jgi:hypothetical protein
MADGMGFLAPRQGGERFPATGRDTFVLEIDAQRFNGEIISLRTPVIIHRSRVSIRAVQAPDQHALSGFAIRYE